MITSKEIDIINGQFTDQEAQEILINIFSTKIQFHELKNLRSIEQTGKQDNVAKKRIPELKTGIDELLKIVSKAKKNNQILTIQSTITVSIIEK
jgi:hypothetical protein